MRTAKLTEIPFVMKYTPVRYMIRIEYDPNALHYYYIWDRYDRLITGIGQPPFDIIEPRMPGPMMFGFEFPQGGDSCFRIYMSTHTKQYIYAIYFDGHHIHNILCGPNPRIPVPNETAYPKPGINITIDLPPKLIYSEYAI